MNLRQSLPYIFIVYSISFSTNQVNQIVASVQGQNQVTSGGVTIVKVGGNQPAAPSTQVGYTRRAKLGDSRSTGRLHTATNTNTHRSMTRLNIASGSVGGLHKSMTRLSSSQQINNVPVANSTAAPTPPLSNNIIVTGTNKWGVPNMRVLSGGVTVTTISQPRIPRPLSQGPLTLISSSNQSSNQVSYL